MKESDDDITVIRPPKRGAVMAYAKRGAVARLTIGSWTRAIVELRGAPDLIRQVFDELNDQEVTT